MPKKIAAGLAALALLFAACGDDDDDAATDTSTAATETTADQATETTQAPAAEAAAVDVATTSLGDVLVDAQGYTLYIFTNDQPNTSNCTGQCLDTWPPAVVESGFAVGDALDQSLFGTIDAPSGTQLTANQLPLYTFAPDTAPGDVNGQGVGGVWWVVGADGNPIQG